METPANATELIVGLIVGILSYFFGHRSGRKYRK